MPRDPRGWKGPSLEEFLLIKNNYKNEPETNKEPKTKGELESTDSNEQNSEASKETNKFTPNEPDQSDKEEKKEEIHNETESKMRGQEETNEILERLNEILPESGNFTIELLNKYYKALNFFVQNFDLIRLWDILLKPRKQLLTI